MNASGTTVAAEPTRPCASQSRQRPIGPAAVNQMPIAQTMPAAIRREPPAVAAMLGVEFARGGGLGADHARPLPRRPAPAERQSAAITRASRTIGLRL